MPDENKITKSLCIKIFEHSEGGYNIDVFNTEDPEEGQDCLDGGIFEGRSIKGALKMAVGIANDLMK